MSSLPSAIQSAATTSSLVTVSSRSLTSRNLFETEDLTSALSPTAWSSAFSKVETSPPFMKTRTISSLLVLRIERTSAPAFWGFTWRPESASATSLLFWVPAQRAQEPLSSSSLYFIFLLFHQLPFPILFWGLDSGGRSVRWRYAALPFPGKPIFGGRRSNPLLPLCQLFGGISQTQSAVSGRYLSF